MNRYGFINDDLMKYCFTEITTGDTKGLFYCNLCQESPQKISKAYARNSGCGNLWSHLANKDHKDLWGNYIGRKKLINRSLQSGPIDAYIPQPSPTASRYYVWMQLIIDKLLPLAVCDENYAEFREIPLESFVQRP